LTDATEDSQCGIPQRNGHWTCTSTPPALCPNASSNGGIDQTTSQLLASGQMLQYTLFAKLANGASGFVSNTASAASNDVNVAEIDASNNSATDTDPIVGDGIFREEFESLGIAVLRAPVPQ